MTNRLDVASPARPAWLAAVILLAVIVLAYAPISFLGRTLAPTAYVPFAATGEPAGRIAEAHFNVDLATPAYYEAPINRLAGRFWREGILPLWNPYQGSGTPLAAQMSTRVFFPYQVLEDIAPEALTDAFLLGRLWLAALGTFAFLRLLGIGFISACGGAVFFALSGGLTWFINLEQMANVAMMVPAHMAAVALLTEHRRIRVGVPAVAATSALILLAGQPETALFALALGGILALWRLVQLSLPVAQPLAIWFILASALGAALAAPLLVPFFELMNQGFHLHGADSMMGTRDATGLRFFGGIIFPTLTMQLTPPQDVTYNGIWDLLGGYCGLVVPLLIALALARGCNRWRGILLLLGGSGLVIVLKNFGVPPFLWLGHLPFFDQVWSQRWAGPVWTFAFAAAAGIAMEILANGDAARRGKHFLTAAGVVAVALLTALPLAIESLATLTDQPGRLVGALVALAAGAAVAVITTKRLSGKAGVAIIALALSELWFDIPKGYDAAAQLRQALPVLLLALAGWLTLRNQAIAAALAAFAAIGGYIAVDHGALKGFPTRHDAYARTPYMDFLAANIGSSRVVGLGGIMFPQAASALGLRDINYINALSPQSFQAFATQILQSEAPNHFESLWLTGRPRPLSAPEQLPRLHDPGQEFLELRKGYEFLGTRFIATPRDWNLLQTPSTRPALASPKMPTMIAVSGKMTASDQLRRDDDARRLTDDNPGTGWHVTNRPEVARHWVAIQMDEAVIVDAIAVQPLDRSQFWIYDHAVFEGSDDGEVWVSLARLGISLNKIPASGPGWLSWRFDNDHAYRHYRLVIDDPFGGLASLQVGRWVGSNSIVSAAPIGAPPADIVAPIAVKASDSNSDAQSPERVLDANPATYWHARYPLSTDTRWLRFEFDRPQSLGTVAILTRQDTSQLWHGPRLMVQAAATPDGPWNDLATVNLPPTPLAAGDWVTAHFDNRASFRYYRIISDDQAFLSVAELRWGPASTIVAPAAPLQLIYDGETRIYENVTALPRAFTVADVLTVTTQQQALAAFNQTHFMPRWQAVVEMSEPRPIRLDPASNDAYVVLVEDRPGRVVVELESQGPSFLVLTDTHYPGWQARVNGEIVDIFRVNGVSRGVLVPGGGSTVEFTYLPHSFRIGLAIALLALLAIAAIAFTGGGTGRRKAAHAE